MTKGNNLLGTFELSGIPPAPRGIPQIEVMFEIDVNGILRVSAEDKGTGNKNNIVLQNNQNRLSEEEIARMVEDAKRFEEEDKMLKEKIDAKNDLEHLVYSLRNQLNGSLKDKLSEEDLNTIDVALKEQLQWMENHPEANTEEFTARKEELESIVQPIIKQLYENGQHEEL